MTWNAQKWLALFFVAGVLSGQTVLAQTSVFIGGYGNSRTNANLTETVLTPSTVKPGEFGKRFSLTVDGQIYAQPLYVRGGRFRNRSWVSISVWEVSKAAGRRWARLWLNPARNLKSNSRTSRSSTAMKQDTGQTVRNAGYGRSWLPSLLSIRWR